MIFNHDDGHEGFQMMGILNALKTGDIHMDMIIAMCVPLFLKMIFNWFGRLDELFDWELWAHFFAKKQTENERFISNSITTTSSGGRVNDDDDVHNSVLLKAIKLYLDQVVKLDLKSAHLDLTGLDDKNYDGYYSDGYDSDTDNDSEDNYCYGSQKTLAGQLSRYKIINRLPNNEWHEIGNYGELQGAVRLRIEQSTMNKDDDKKDGGNTSNHNNNNSNSRETQNTTFHFLSSEKGAIDAFIDTAYKWYLEELRKMEDNSRFYYEMKVPEIKFGRTDNISDVVRYKRYKLSEEKSFESLFFREKESLLALIKHFTHKTGKYSIPGYPQKLGLLLHGPPGTGKTSLIKALAQYTGRSIVNVPLSRVATNSELMSVFFDRKFHVEGAYAPVKLGFKDVIFVMEDCDAASKVVKRRDGQRPAELATSAESIVMLPTPKSLWRLLLESTSSECQDVVDALLEKSERLKTEAEKQRPDVLRAIAKRLNDQPALGLVDEGTENRAIAQACAEALEMAVEIKERRSKLDDILDSHAKAIMKLLASGAEVNDEFVDELLGETRLIPSHVSTTNKPRSSVQQHEVVTRRDWMAGFDGAVNTAMLDSQSSNEEMKGVGLPFLRPNPDALSLSGLLNVLDGVVDCPGRIVILTSNHPEMLDPALIRPGRVDKTLLLGFMEATDMIQMLELYYQTSLTDDQIARIQFAVNGPHGDAECVLKLTPAQIEQLAAEHDVLDDIIVALEEKSPFVVSKAKTTMLKDDADVTCRP